MRVPRIAQTACRRWQIAVVLVLATLLSGAGNLFASHDGDDRCADDCGWGHNCPPNCARGACAKVSPSLTPSHYTFETFREVREAPEREAAVRPAEPVLDGIFHPPRR